MKNIIKKFDVNNKGRDFVIGDLHGSFSVLENLLKNINFDKSIDRMFSVGDLVDRGPDSLSCIELLYESWFHPVKANHEQLMLECFRGGYLGDYWYQNGGHWGMEAVNDFRSKRVPMGENQRVIDILPLVEQMPYLITVETKSGKKFHILHAELPYTDDKITDEMLSDPATTEVIAKTSAFYGEEAFLWNRNLFLSMYARDLSDRDKIVRIVKQDKSFDIFNDGLSHIISGHTIVQRPFTCVGQTNIDTAAVQSTRPSPPKWAALTCIELETWKFYQATEKEFREVEPFVITKADLL